MLGVKTDNIFEGSYFKLTVNSILLSSTTCRFAVSQPLPAPAARLPLGRRRPPLLQDLRPDDALLGAGAVGARRQGRRPRHSNRPRRLPVGAQVRSEKYLYRVVHQLVKRKTKIPM